MVNAFHIQLPAVDLVRQGISQDVLDLRVADGTPLHGQEAVVFQRHNLPSSVHKNRKQVLAKASTCLVRPTRFERATYRVGVCHSIQLSYERIFD